jgi:hypothetical protein
MANGKSQRKFLTNEEGSQAERLWRLMEWAEIIHKDMADFIGALDRLYMDMQSKGKPASKDFLTAVNNNKE